MEDTAEKDFEPETVIQLLDVYLTEWIHRDAFLWEQTNRYFYAILIFIILPSIAPFLNIKLPPFTPKIFPVLGILLTGFFCYISLGNAKRLEASGVTYQNLINTLPVKYQRVRIKNINGKIYDVRLSKYIPILLSSALIAICIAMLWAVNSGQCHLSP